MHYTCIACITIDSVTRMDKKIICKFIQKNANTKQKKIQIFRFINAKLESDSDSESKSDTELKSESEVESDTE